MAVHEPTLIDPQEIAARRALPEPTAQVAFKVTNLYGVSSESIEMPLNETESIDSGQVVLTLDPEAAPGSNFGVVDFDARKLRVRYGIQAVFPGLFELITSGRHDTRLLQPIKAVATDDCDVAADYRGWHARGRMDFLPGSLWSGAGGG